MKILKIIKNCLNLLINKIKWEVHFTIINFVKKSKNNVKLQMNMEIVNLVMKVII